MRLIGANMIPDRQQAMAELEEAGRLNPGMWTAHCRNAALAAYFIAEKIDNMDEEKAYILGLLHDIGRRVGIVTNRHIIEGYRYMMSKGYEEAARICITHSYPIKDTAKNLGKDDLTPEDNEFLRKYIEDTAYDDYDKLIILCDSLATAEGLCLLEKRFVDTTIRYGMFPFTVERWETTFAYKNYFENKMGCSVYEVLPGVKESTFI